MEESKNWEEDYTIFLINELEEQKTSYQVYKDQNELKIKENKEKIDEISNQNEENQKRIENLINELYEKKNKKKI